MKISIVRGAFLNPFELQNYYPLKQKYDLNAVSSLHPLSSDIDLPLIKLPSPTDLPNFPKKYPILNRLFIDAHYLYGLESVIQGSDIVHVAETYYHYTIQAIRAKQKGRVKKIVSTVWEIIPHNNESIHGRKHFKQLSYQYIDHFIAVTDLAKQSLLKEGVEESRITVIPMGIDIKKFHPHKTKTNNKINILFTGRFVTEKGIGELASVAEKIQSHFPTVHFTFVGDGPLKKLIPKNSKTQTKTVIYSRMPQEYQKADIFCLPSQTTPTWQEQFGMAFVEAMSSGLPIVTTISGAIPEVCGKAALYTKQGSPQDLYRLLTSLLNNPSLRAVLSHRARARAEKLYDHNKVAQKIDRVYQSLFPR